jgi:hypothetical protein
LSEQAPILPTPHDLAIKAAEGANLAPSDLLVAKAYSDLLVAKVARAVIEAAVLAADNLGLEGVSVEPQAYDALDAKIHEAEENFELYGQMVAADMPAREAGPEEQHTRDVSQDIPPAPAPQPGKQEPEANARPSTQELIKQKDDSKQRHASILYEFLTRSDVNGVCQGENVDEVIRTVVGATQRQWNSSITQLEKWRCITTEPGEKDRIAKVAVDWDMVEVNIGLGKVSPFPDGLTATDIMKAKWDEAGEADRAPKPPLSEPPATETEPAIRSDKESSAPEASPQASRAAAAESKPTDKELYTNLLRQVLLQVDSSGTYESENLQEELAQELEVSPTKLRSLVRKLIAWQCISIRQGPKGELIGVTVDTAMVDREIIKRRIGLFPDEKTATDLLKSRQRELARSGPDDEETSAATGSDDLYTEPKNPAPSTTKLSARVRRQLEIDARKGQTEALPDPDELSEHEHAIIDLRAQVNMLTDDQYFLLEPLAKVMLAFLKPNILEGSSSDGPSLMEQLQEATELTVDDIQPAYTVIRSRDYLEVEVDGQVRKPQPTRPAFHFMRNAIADAIEHS